jgi:hypothetical protein
MMKKTNCAVKEATDIPIVRSEEAGMAIVVTLALILNVRAALVPPGNGWLYSIAMDEAPAPIA